MIYIIIIMCEMVGGNVHYIYFIFYQCTNIFINLCTLIAYSLMTPHKKKEKNCMFLLNFRDYF